MLSTTVLCRLQPSRRKTVPGPPCAARIVPPFCGRLWGSRAANVSRGHHGFQSAHHRCRVRRKREQRALPARIGVTEIDFPAIRARMDELRRENSTKPRAVDDFATIRARIVGSSTSTALQHLIRSKRRIGGGWAHRGAPLASTGTPATLADMRPVAHRPGIIVCCRCRGRDRCSTGVP